MKTRFWPTAVEIAEDVRQSLVVGDTGHAIRMLMDGVNRLPKAHEAGRLAEALAAAPESTGDIRWDTLLAGAIRYRVHSIGESAPQWTVKEPLSVFWWPFAHSASDEYNDMAHTPAELVRLGIFMDEREFWQA